MADQPSPPLSSQSHPRQQTSGQSWSCASIRWPVNLANILLLNPTMRLIITSELVCQHLSGTFTVWKPLNQAHCHVVLYRATWQPHCHSLTQHTLFVTPLRESSHQCIAKADSSLLQLSMPRLWNKCKSLQWFASQSHPCSAQVCSVHFQDKA